MLDSLNPKLFVFGLAYLNYYLYLCKEKKKDMRVKQIARPNQTKACPICGRDLPLEAYSKGTGMYGRRSICKECDRNLHNTPEAREEGD